MFDLSTGECISEIGECIGGGHRTQPQNETGQTLYQGHRNSITHIALAYSVLPDAILIDNNNNNNDNSDMSHKIEAFPLIVSASLDGTIKIWDVNRFGIFLIFFCLGFFDFFVYCVFCDINVKKEK